MTQDEAINAMNLMIRSLKYQIRDDQYFLVSTEIAQHISDLNSTLTGRYKKMKSGDDFEYMGIRCKVA